MNHHSTTSTGEPADLDMADTAEAILENAPLKEENRFDFNASNNGTTGTKEDSSTQQSSAGTNGTAPKTAGSSNTQGTNQNRIEQVLEKLHTKTLTSESFMSAPPARWHIKDFFYAGQVGLMVGQWKAGKTFSALIS